MTKVLIRQVHTHHDRNRFPTPESVADHYGISREAIECHTTKVDGTESDVMTISWRAGTIVPPGVDFITEADTR